MERLGLALIAIGLILVVLPSTGLIRGAILYIAPANEVWFNWQPRGTQTSPIAFSTEARFEVLPEVRRYKGTDWVLPGQCSDWKVVAVIRNSAGTMVRNITYTSLAQHPSYDYLCRPSQTVTVQASTLQPGNYTISWRLAVFDGSSFLGYVENPQRSYFLIDVVPDGYFTINGMRIDPFGRMVVQPPITFVFTATSYADRITKVRIIVTKPDGTGVTQFDLSKTSATTWQGTWNAQVTGQFIVSGDLHTSSNVYRKLSMILDFGGDDGGGLLGINPLQLLGILSMLVGGYLVLFRRR